MKNRNPLTSEKHMKTPRWFSTNRFFSILRIVSAGALLKRRLSILSALCGAFLGLVLATPAGAGTTTSFESTFQLHLGRGVAPLPCSVDFCAVGTVAGFGEATLSGDVTSFTPIPGTSFCANLTATGTITLADGSTLSLMATGIECTTGNSRNTFGSLVSYGNPFSIVGTYTVTGGTGVFAGASGSGGFNVQEAGDVEVFELIGTITL
jgi:hypothetical protein